LVMQRLTFHEKELQLRVRDGLERISSVMRSDMWAAAHELGLNPTQAGILALLASRSKAGIRVKEIAEHLGVSQPTVTDSISALEDKGLVQKLRSTGDARSTLVQITAPGRKMAISISRSGSEMLAAILSLTVHEQSHLLLSLTKLIRNLQQQGAIPVQRMCMSCKYFRPNIHRDAKHPHRCAFVNAAFGLRDIRLDCSDHELAEPIVQAATWDAFNAGTANLHANLT
jgi:DNA-binding MarR family transcriptional regulator